MYKLVVGFLLNYAAAKLIVFVQLKNLCWENSCHLLYIIGLSIKFNYDLKTLSGRWINRIKERKVPCHLWELLSFQVALKTLVVISGNDSGKLQVIWPLVISHQIISSSANWMAQDFHSLYLYFKVTIHNHRDSQTSFLAPVIFQMAAIKSL